MNINNYSINIFVLFYSTTILLSNITLIVLTVILQFKFEISFLALHQHHQAIMLRENLAIPGQFFKLQVYYHKF